MGRNVFLWALYDFGKTPFSVAITGFYLAQWVVLDNHFDDIWYGGTFALSTIFLLVTAPFWGAWSDRVGKRMPFLKWATFLLLFFGLLLAIIAPSSLATTPKVIIVLILFLILQYIYQFGLIFYNALLSKISTPKTLGKVSGIGEVAGALGWLVGPGILLPFAGGAITLFGQPGKAQVFLPAVISLAILCLPMIFWFKESTGKTNDGELDVEKVEKQTFSDLRHLLKRDKNITTLLISCMFVSDALLTIVLYFAIFMDQVYGISDTQKYIILAITGAVAIPSGLIFGIISDKLGAKRTLLLACSSLIVGFTAGALSSAVNILFLVALLAGVGYGGLYATARVFLIKIAPPAQLGEYFGFFSTFQRFASIIGPLIWGVTTLVLKDYGTTKYRAAVLILVGLMIIGTLLLTRVKEEAHETAKLAPALAT